MKSVDLDAAKKQRMSPSSRGCGLKFMSGTKVVTVIKVTLFARVWIEIDLLFSVLR